jgi:uncharacterized protein
MEKKAHSPSLSKRWAASLALSVFIAQPVFAGPTLEASANMPQKLPLSKLMVVSANKSHKFRVQVALSPKEHEIGLMFRKQMPKSEGMLFVFPQPKEASFWMQNTPLSLDLIFIRADGSIANIAAKARPMSTSVIPSVGRVIGVLEINGGLSAKLGIAAGDRVEHKALSK